MAEANDEVGCRAAEGLGKELRHAKRPGPKSTVTRGGVSANMGGVRLVGKRRPGRRVGEPGLRQFGCHWNPRVTMAKSMGSSGSSNRIVFHA